MAEKMTHSSDQPPTPQQSNQVLTTKSESGHSTFNQNLGTKSAAKDHFFIAFTDLPELDPPGRWILGQILEPSTSRKRAASTKYAENWHNFTLLKILSGPSDDWQALVGTDRCINLKLGANWCIVKLNVPIEELDVTISTPDGQPSSHAISPTRHTNDLEVQAPPPGVSTPTP